MSYRVQRSALVRRALQAADMDAAVMSGVGQSWLTTGTVEDLVTESAARFYDLCIDILGPESFSKVAFLDFGPVVQPSPVPLPDDFYRLVALHICDEASAGGHERFEPLQQVAAQGPDFTRLLNAPASEGPYFYQVRRGVVNSTHIEPSCAVHIWPVPLRDRFLRVDYVPSFYGDQRPNGAGTDADPFFDGVDGWDRWVVLDAAIEILGKEESDTSRLERQRDRIEAQMRSKSDKQDTFHAQVPIDMRSMEESMPMHGRWPWPFG